MKNNTSPICHIRLAKADVLCLCLSSKKSASESLAMFRGAHGPLRYLIHRATRSKPV
jgi:hypothetical protein